MAEAERQEESAVRKRILYAALTAAALMVPSESVQLGKMKPVELIAVRAEDGQVCLETDTGDSGTGDNVAEALANMKEASTGIICLDTAMYLLVAEDADRWIPELEPYLKDKIYIAQLDGRVELKKAADILSVHKPSVQMKDWEEGTALEEIRQKKGKLIFVEK